MPAPLRNAANRGHPRLRPERHAHSVALLTGVTLGHELAPAPPPVLNQEDHQTLPSSDLIKH
eukprot:9473176-Pyramimonas_sp.AAC.2